MKHTVLLMRLTFVAFALVNTNMWAQDSTPVRITDLQTNVESSFRGLAMRGEKEVWATGSQDTVIRSIDGGKTWTRIRVPHPTAKDKDGKPVSFDYRDIELLADGSVIVMSIGNGEASNLFRSTDNGQSWKTVLANKEPAGFFDGLVFAEDGKRGLLYGDPLRGRLDLYSTNDGGKTWQPVPEEQRPKLEEGEYGFAASGSGAAMVGSEIWIGTGGSIARIHHSKDNGKTWAARHAPIRMGNASSGIFSIAVADDKRLVAVGGDYLKPNEAAGNVVVTIDGGKGWLDLQGLEMPHKACVKWLGGDRFLTCGRTGVAFSDDGGVTWSLVSDESWYVCSFDAKSNVGFLAGANGRVSRFTLKQGQ